jgi:hypothetical protein
LATIARGPRMRAVDDPLSVATLREKRGRHLWSHARAPRLGLMAIRCRYCSLEIVVARTQHCPKCGSVLGGGETVFVPPEAMILGDLKKVPNDFAVIEGAGANADGTTSTFFFYSSGGLLGADAILVRTTSDPRLLPRTPYENFVLASIDGKKSIREIQRGSAVRRRDILVAVLTLLEKKLVALHPAMEAEPPLRDPSGFRGPDGFTPEPPTSDLLGALAQGQDEVPEIDASLLVELSVPDASAEDGPQQQPQPIAPREAPSVSPPRARPRSPSATSPSRPMREARAPSEPPAMVPRSPSHPGRDSVPVRPAGGLGPPMNGDFVPPRSSPAGLPSPPPRASTAPRSSPAPRADSVPRSPAPPSPSPTMRHLPTPPAVRPFDLSRRAGELFRAALAAKERGNLVAARMNVKLALSFDPQNPLFLRTLKELTEQVQRSGAAGASERERFYNAIAEAERSGRVDDAIRILEQEIKKQPPDPDAFNRLGVITALRKGNFARAQLLIQRAIDLAPGNRTYEHNMAKILSAAAERELASKERRAARRSPSFLDFLKKK